MGSKSCHHPELLKAYRKGGITQKKFKVIYLEHLQANEGQEADKGGNGGTEVSRS